MESAQLTKRVPAAHISEKPGIRSSKAQANNDFSFLALWRVLVKRQRMLWTTAGVVLGLTVLVTLWMTREYAATCQIEINKESSDMLGGVDGISGVSGATDALDYNVTLQTQARVLASDSLALQVIEQLNLDQRPEFSAPKHWFFGGSKEKSGLALSKNRERRDSVLELFHRKLSIKTVPGTRIIEIQYLSPDADVAANVVNTLVKDYLEQYFRTRFAATMQASDWLSKQLDDLKAQVEESQKKLADYQKHSGILGTDESNNVVMVKLEQVNQQLTAAEGNRIMKQAVWEITKSGDPEQVSGMAGSGLLANVPVGGNPAALSLLQSLRAQQAQLNVQYAEATTKYDSEYPRVVELRSQLAQLEKDIHLEVAKIAARAKNDYIAAQHSEDMLRAALERQKEEANKLNGSAVQYTILKQEAQSGGDLYQELLKKLKEAGVLAGLQSTNIVVFDPAAPASKPVHPRVLLNLAGGLFGGLFLGITLAFAMESLDETIRTPEQAEAITLVPSLGVIPVFGATNDQLWMPNRQSSESSQLQPASSPVSSNQRRISEAYRSLRTSILLTNADASTKVVLITSALPGEGKTTTTLNLASVLAQQGARVLLVDADMRLSSIRSKVESQDGGLSTLLTTSGDLKSNVCESKDVPNLFILASGPNPPYPADLLGSRRMGELLKLWREEFDYVLIDSPPVLAVSDAVVLSPHVDLSLVVVRCGRTTRDAVTKGLRELMRGGMQIGTVINAVDAKSRDYYYNYDDYYNAN